MGKSPTGLFLRGPPHCHYRLIPASQGMVGGGKNSFASCLRPLQEAGEPETCEARPQSPHWSLDLSEFVAKEVRARLSPVPSQGPSTLPGLALPPSSHQTWAGAMAFWGAALRKQPFCPGDLGVCLAYGRPSPNCPGNLCFLLPCSRRKNREWGQDT